MKTHLSITIAALTAFGSLGCSKEQTQEPETPASADAQTAEPASEASGKESDDPQQSQINISDEIQKACGLSNTDAHFAFNSANVRQEDKAVLAKLAECFASGPLKGRTMNLVGHADPRGEPEYNMVLAGRRADNVGSAIVDAGLPEDQLTTTSRGEMDATGTDEASWARDRRVDIVLAEAD